MTERITEDLVRSHFKSDPIFDQVTLEEQKSSRERIQKLFACASKNLTKKPGFPEFIVSFSGKPDLLLVVECKLSQSAHQSSKRNNPKSFAVDGILHYIRCAKAVDPALSVIGIAVSGADSSSFEVTHFYAPAGADTLTETKDTKLLSIQSYLFLHDNAAYAKALSNLHIQQKAVEYNNVLYQHEIPENERCTFVSAVLVSLQDEFFRSTYVKASDVEELISEIIKACDRVLKKNGITEDRRATIIHVYENIKGHKITKVKRLRNKLTGKEEDNEAVRDFIVRIHKEIYPLVLHEEQGFDVLGRFYREFVRYAGSDQATGLVLTPEHIADLFCDLVKLTPDDVVYDPCCGTGGFLISALKRMIALSGNDYDKIRTIKEKQLIGSEVRADMFT